VPVTITFALLARATIATITELSKKLRTLTGTFGPANIYVFSPSVEIPHVTHADQAIATLTVRVAISILVFTGTAKGTEVVMSFGNWTVLVATWINAR
jgi:hypothetical protein